MMFEFIHLLAFTAKSGRMRISLEDQRGIENEIMSDPEAWPVVPGSGGLRKMRFALGSRAGGKSGGIRVCYFVLSVAHKVYLVTLFAKNEKENLAKAEIQAISKLIAEIKQFHKEAKP